MPRSNSRGGRNNNPSGRNQYSDWGVMEMVRERPIAAAAATVGAAATGLFLWSKRTQIGDQLSNLSDQFSEWKAGQAGDDSPGGLPTAVASETGGGTTARRSGGSGTAGAVSGRGRARSQPTT